MNFSSQSGVLLVQGIYKDNGMFFDEDPLNMEAVFKDTELFIKLSVHNSKQNFGKT